MSSDNNITFTCDLLVVGGGIAGITAAVEAAEVGKTVTLVEREHYLGGRVAQLHRYFPKMCPPICGLEINFRRIRQNSKITVLTGASPSGVIGNPGDFHATVKISPRYINEKCTACGDCEKACQIEVPDRFNFGLTKAKAARLPHELAFPFRYFIDAAAVGNPLMKEVAAACTVGAIELDMRERTVEIDAKSIIWATGWEPYDALKLESLGFGRLPNVVTNMIFERMAAPGGVNNGKITRSSDGAAITRAAFVQCAGSRDENHLPYCSAVCCMASLKQTRYLREQNPEAELHIFFIDARTPGRWEDFYQEIQNDSKCIIHRGKVGSIEAGENGRVRLTAENTLTGQLEQVSVDLAVLAVGMVPTALKEPPPEVRRDEYGFLSNNGAKTILTAGVAAGPKDVATTNEEATGVVALALKQMAGR
jgi:quinone-modifying oxidoreductase subunit QmoA